MILPASISVTKAAEVIPPSPTLSTLEPDGEPSTNARVICRNAVVNQTDRMCASVLIVKPKASSTIRHNGEQEAIIYTVSGTGALLSAPKDEDEDEDEKPERHPIAKGDFAFIPAWTEHQVVNESDDEDLHLVITRTGPQPVEVGLVDWGGDEAKEPEPPQEQR